MSRHARVALLLVSLAVMLMLEGTRDAIARSKPPDPINTGVAETLYRLDRGHSLANDESVWTPGENIGRNLEFSSTCWPLANGVLNLPPAACITLTGRVVSTNGQRHALEQAYQIKANGPMAILRALPALARRLIKASAWVGAATAPPSR